MSQDPSSWFCYSPLGGFDPGLPGSQFLEARMLPTELPGLGQHNPIFFVIFHRFYFKSPCMVWMPMYGPEGGVGVTPCSEIIVGDWVYGPFQNKFYFFAESYIFFEVSQYVLFLLFISDAVLKILVVLARFAGHGFYKIEIMFRYTLFPYFWPQWFFKNQSFFKQEQTLFNDLRHWQKLKNNEITKGEKYCKNKKVCTIFLW